MIFRDSLGMCFHSLVLARIDHVDTVSFLPGYSGQKNLPWKHWLELTAKEAFCLIGWEDGILPPGPDFDIKKLTASEIRDVARSYVDSTLNGSDDYQAFSVICWSAGMRVY